MQGYLSISMYGEAGHPVVRPPPSVPWSAMLGTHTKERVTRQTWTAGKEAPSLWAHQADNRKGQRSIGTNKIGSVQVIQKNWLCLGQGIVWTRRAAGGDDQPQTA